MDKKGNWRPTKKYMRAYENLYGSSPIKYAVPIKKLPKPLLPTEWEEQVQLIDWLDSYDIPVIAIPNEGVRSHWEGQRMRRAGLRKGAPDMLIPAPTKTSPGLFIELKRRQLYKISPEQYEWIARLQKLGYTAVIAIGADDAMRVVREYFGGVYNGKSLL